MIKIKNLLVYQSGETIPFLIVRCDKFRTDPSGIFIERNNTEHFLSMDWDYYLEIEDNENHKEIVDLFKTFQEKIKKYE
mgnify:CR=1 FL=1